MLRGPASPLRQIVASDGARFFLAAAVAALLVTVVAGAAGLARVLPILLDPEVPRRAARPFLLGLLALSLEVGILVGWALGFAEVAVRSRERGEARARMALGESPGRRILRLWPVLVLLSCLGAIASLAWGRDARAPGRVARALLEEGRIACESKTERSVVDVPLVRASWLCRPERAPLLVGEGAGVDFVARELVIADDLGSLEGREVQILVRAASPVRLYVAEVRLGGLVPFSAPSSVPPIARALALVSAALLAAVLSTHSALRDGRRVVAWIVALAGPAATLTALRLCERAAIGDLRLVAIPAASAVGIFTVRLLLFVLARLRDAHARRGRPLARSTTLGGR